jgi:serine/threonine-protein kinase
VESHLSVVPSSPSDAQLATGQVLGSYRIEGVLGEGTMGRVYLGRHVTLERAAALKVLHERHTQNPALIQRFFQEARLVNRIAHEHIVEVFDFVQSQQPPVVYGVMELLNGETLSARLAARAPSLDSVVRIGQQISQALQAAHAVGVVHRDLKPDNVFLVTRGGRDDYVKVLDFGVAKLAQPLGTSSVVVSTSSGSVIGTPRYMSPEQAAGLEAEPSADVYALGVILYELLAGKVPFGSLSFGQLAADIITKPPPPLPDRSAGGERIPPALADLVEACLEKQTSARPPSMASVEAWLGRALTSGASVAAQPAPRGGKWLPGAAAAAAVLVTVAVLAARHVPSSAVPAPPQPLPAPVEQLPAAGALPSLVSLSLTTSPPGAHLTRVDTGELLGVTPWVGSMQRSASALKLRIEAVGYEPTERDISLAADATVDLALKPLRVRPVAKHPFQRPKQPQSIRNGVIDPF